MSSDVDTLACLDCHRKDIMNKRILEDQQILTVMQHFFYLSPTGLQTIKFHFHTFPLIFNYSLISERTVNRSFVHKLMNS